MCGPGATGWASLLCPGCSTARRWPGSGCLRGRNLERSRERWWFFKAAGPVGPRVRRETVRSGILPQPLPKPAVGGLALRVLREESLRVMAEPCAKLRSNPCCMCLVVSAIRPPRDSPGFRTCPGSLPKASPGRGLRSCVRPELRPPVPGTGSCRARGRHRPWPVAPCGCPVPRCGRPAS